VQCAAGFLAQLDGLPDLSAAPFHFPHRYAAALQLVQKGVRTFETTSAGRLFDTVAGLLGFTRAVTFEGQAAMWLEHLARLSPDCCAYSFPVEGGELDFRELLEAIVCDRLRGRGPAEVARAFHGAVAHAIGEAVLTLCGAHGIETVVLSGGVFQNDLLLESLKAMPALQRLTIWTNSAVPPNDGGISLGQAALAAFSA
jgi:hydrogenase maturation protein HypF